MAHVICKTRCYTECREFLPGEVLRVDGDDVPVHFKAATDEEVQGKRVYLTQPKPKPLVATNTAADRIDRGEPVSISELL